MRSTRICAPQLTVLIMAVIAVTVFAASARPAFTQSTGPSWSYTGSLNTPRYGHTATLLPNGKVLVVGGASGADLLDSAELYDPATGTWSLTGHLNVAHWFHTATLLPNGKVLVAGGQATNGYPFFAAHTAEIYDPATGTWSLTGNLNVPRLFHTATLLPNGKVLITGGDIGNYAATNTAELYDPNTGAWSVTGSLNWARLSHTATLLSNGSVLVAGGSCTEDYDCFYSGTELYDPNSGAWSATGNLNTIRVAQTATLLPDGNVLLAGGAYAHPNLDSTELYNIANGKWSYSGNLSWRLNHTATLLANGQVLVAGGSHYDIGIPRSDTTLGSVYIYDPTTGKWTGTASLNAPRFWHTATLLPNGKVLVVGGYDGRFDPSTSLRSAELYDLGVVFNPNPIDDPQFFVRQQYLDFLNREPDSNGLVFWTSEITSCGMDQQCMEVKRINVSAAYFLSIEFQQTGYLVYRMYKAAYGNLPNAPVPIRFNEFLPDTREIGQGVIVNQAGWETVLESNKQAFINEFVNRSRFTSAYPQSMSPAEFVATLNSNVGNLLSATEQDQLVTDLISGRKTRAQVLRAVAENQKLISTDFNAAFVLMQYFGYLRRDPNSGPDTDFSGYNFWLNKLSAFNGDYASAEMIKAFISSSEYRQRFGPN